MIEDSTLSLQIKALAEQTRYSPEELESAACLLAARLLPDVTAYADRYNVGLRGAVLAATDYHSGPLANWARPKSDDE